MLDINVNTLNKLNELKGQLDNKESNNKLIKTKVEIKDIDINKQIKQVKIEINTNYNNLHSNINKDVVVNKINNNQQEEKKQVKKGQLWYVNFGQRQGSLQSGIRPALVDSNDINNRFSNIINVYPLTSNMAKANNIPVHVIVEGFNLKESSVILIEQDTPIDVRYQLLTYIGTVDELVLKKVEKARNIQRGILKEKTPLERLPQEVQNMINGKLEDIRSCERTITNIKRESLIKHLMEEREAYLLSLQRFCREYDIDYHDYYVMYRKEEERSVI